MASLGRRLTNIADLLTTKGNLIVGNGTSWQALAVSGTDTDLLVADSAEASGLNYTAAPVSAAYAAAVIADGPLFYWKMNEASGAPQDSSGNGNHATVASTWNYQVAGPIAEEGQYAMDSINTSGLLYHPFFIPSISGEVSFEIWAKSAISPRTEQTVLFACWSQTGGTANQHAYLATTGSTFGRFTVWDGTPALHNALGSTTNLADGAWHHIVGTQGAIGGCRLYVDGALEASTSGGTNTVRANSSVAYTVNNFSSGSAGKAWIEPLAHAAFYNYELTAAQVAAHYAAAGV